MAPEESSSIERWLRGLAVALTVVAVLAAICVRDEFGHLVGIIGVWVSSLGVLLAYAIYDRQRRDSRESEDRTRDHVDERFDHLLTLIAAPQDSGDESEDDGFEQESDALEQFGTLVGDGVQRLSAEHVPLTVVADVVNQWTHDGNAGAWASSRGQCTVAAA